MVFNFDGHVLLGFSVKGALIKIVLKGDDLIQFSKTMV
jgi:hypothetical protein